MKMNRIYSFDLSPAIEATLYNKLRRMVSYSLCRFIWSNLGEFKLGELQVDLPSLMIHEQIKELKKQEETK